MKKSTKDFLIGFGISAAVIGGIIITNESIAKYTANLPYLLSSQGKSFESSLGNIYYNKSGHGSPILLIHNIYDGYGSSYEWSKIEPILAKEHTVYSIDLIGCGRSDKCYTIYTNFMFSALIVQFIRDVVKEPVHLVTSGNSSDFGIMASVLREDLITKITMLNPGSIEESKVGTSIADRILYTFRSIPVFGTFLYNIKHTKKAIQYRLDHEGFYNIASYYSYDWKTMYKAAHIKQNKAIYLVNSVKAHFTNIDVTDALSKLSVPIRLILCEPTPESAENASAIMKLTKNCKCRVMNQAKAMAALECPSELAQMIK